MQVMLYVGCVLYVRSGETFHKFATPFLVYCATHLSKCEAFKTWILWTEIKKNAPLNVDSGAEWVRESRSVNSM